MSEGASPDVAVEAHQTGRESLGDAEIERILADFRDWLRSYSPNVPQDAAEPPEETVDLSTLVRHFTALRHEVNLQTRAGRAQLEQNAQTIEALERAVRDRDANSTTIPTPPAEAARPWLKTLIEIRDALALAEKPVARSREALAAAAPPPVVAIPGWANWLGLASSFRAAIAPLEAWARERSDDARRATLDALAAGYAMSLERLDRALSKHGLEPIGAAGDPFDPETMEVLEVVRDTSRTSSVVIEVIRPGYRLSGQIFRCAQVRVARP